MLQKKISKNIEYTSKRKLSIQFSLDGFSFCISNAEDSIVHFSSYSFDDETTTPESLVQHIEEIFKTDTDLHYDFDSVTVIHENHLNSLVPNRYFKQDALKSYLNYNIKTISTDYITHDDLDELHMKNVYVPYVNVNNFLFQNFGEFEFKHHASVLIEKLVHQSKKDTTHFYVNVTKSALDIVVIQDQSLQYFNSFEYHTKEDFIYYILFTFEQLQLDPNEQMVQLTGAIEKPSDLYEIAYKYIRHVDFLTTSLESFAKDKLEHHSNYILLG